MRSWPCLNFYRGSKANTSPSSAIGKRVTGFLQKFPDDADSWKITKHVVVPVVQYLETHNEQLNNVLNIRIVVFSSLTGL